jgi:Tol biopolymer transport system component
MTVSGRGYSFVADVREPVAGHTQTAGTGRRRDRFRRIEFGAVALCAAFLVIGAVYFGPALSGRRANESQMTAVPLTAFPGGEYEPSFSPDGDRLAFVWDGENQNNFDIYVMPVGSGTPRRITTDPAGEGSPSWSPDGRSIAFLRYSEQPGVSSVYVVPALGGPERRVTEVFPIAHLFDRHLDWSPWEKLLAIVDKESAEGPFRIYLVSPESGQRRPLTFPPAGLIGDTGPQFSPDGRSIAFRRTTSSSVNELFVIPTAGGDARRLTFDNAFISGHAWMPGGREMIFASTRSGNKALWRISLVTGALNTIPGIGTKAYFLTLSRRGDRLAYSEWFADTNIWRMALQPHETNAEKPVPVPIVASTLQDLSPQYSPDASKIAFRSNRSGYDEIWVTDREGRNPNQLTFFRGPLTGTPRWSPNGTAITFDSRPQGNGDIYVVEASGGAPRRITTNPADDVVPSWSRDGRWIYFGSNRTGNWQVWKVPVQGERDGRYSVQVTRKGGFAAFESPDGRWLYYAKGLDVPGLWRVPVEGGEEAPIITGLKARYWGYWAIADAGIYFLDPLPAAGCAVKFFSFDLQRVSTVAILPKQPPYADSGLTISRDGTSILYPQIDHAGSNIMLVENFR